MELPQDNKDKGEKKTMANRTTIYHPNPKGTGMALALELYPATPEVPGKLQLEFARQVSPEGATFPRFDWENRSIFVLTPEEVEKVLEVFNGYTESIEDGKGIFVWTPAKSTALRLRHVVNPVPAYALQLVVREGEGDAATHDVRDINLTPTEAMMLYHALTAAMGMLVFGL